MREIQFNDIVTTIKHMIMHTSTVLPQDMLNALQKAYEEEESKVAKEVIKQLLENAKIAKDEITIIIIITKPPNCLVVSGNSFIL